MVRPRILLVGGRPLVAEMLIEHLRHGDRYEPELVQYCDDALAVLWGRQIDLVFVSESPRALIAPFFREIVEQLFLLNGRSTSLSRLETVLTLSPFQSGE